jgi:prephenate dehydratase
VIAIVRHVIPVALIHHWLLLHWPSVAGPAVGVLGILIAIVAHRRAARAAAECTALINGSIGSRGTVDPRAFRDLTVVRYDALSEMSGQLSFSVALLNALGDGVVLSSINGRTETRTYAKIVRSGRAGRCPRPRARARAAPARAGIMWAMPYAYLGPEGTFSEAALHAVDPGAEPLSCPTIQAALAAVRDGTAERAVVPIESSVEGVVTATLDDLATGNGMVIRAELQIPIAFALLARPGTAFGDIKRVGGHPQSMPQCRGWLAANLPDSEWVPLASNAEAARQAADGQVDAALAGAFAADRYSLAVIAPDVHDRASAVTRFVVVSPPGPLPARTGADRTSVALFLAEDHPGALLEILTEFAVRGVNLTTIQSRPTGDRLGQYYFFIDCEGHVDDARVGEALMGLRRVCREVRFLGSYARCDGGSTHVRPGTSDGEFADAAAWLGRLRFGRP